MPALDCVMVMARALALLEPMAEANEDAKLEEAVSPGLPAAEYAWADASAKALALPVDADAWAMAEAMEVEEPLLKALLNA